MQLANNSYQKYKQQSIFTASPEKLLIMLFDGAIRFTNQAKKAIEEKNNEKSNYYIIRCQDIIQELILSLNMEYEISNYLMQMYDYIKFNLIQANINKDLTYLNEADKYLKELRETWIEVAKLAKTQL